MTSTYKKANTQHSHWLPSIPSTSSSATTFPHFALLPFELQTQIWQYASIPEPIQPIPPLLDLALNQQDDASSLPFSANWHPTVFFPGELRLSAQFLRGLETTRKYQGKRYPSLYAALWKRLAISSQYDLGRALAQTCSLARLIVLKEWKQQIEGIEGDDFDRHGASIPNIRQELVRDVQEMINDVGTRG